MANDYDYDLDPVSFITIGAQGVPGERTFYLQAANDDHLLSLIIEKEHAFILAANLTEMLDALSDEAPMGPEELFKRSSALALVEPLSPAFRVSRLGLGVDEQEERVVLVAEEAPEGEAGLKARFVATFEQMLALAHHALEVVNQGRPICQLCGEPIGTEGHFCARKNGHKVYESA